MKAISYHHFGNTDVLQMIEESKPSVESNQVLIKVKAVSINPMDWKIRKGEMKLMSGSKFPRHTGVDFAGIVEATGSAVTDFKPGDEVFGVVKNNMKDGALSEYVAVPFNLVWKKPAGINFNQAASIPIVGSAALTALEKMGKITSQTKILVNGATGGFGMFLLQLLREKGTHVTAVASTKAIEYAKKWGADVVVDYTKENILTQNQTYDIIVDLSGKMEYAQAKKIMKPKARFLNVAPQPIEIPTSLLKNLFTGKKQVMVLSSPSIKYMNKLINAINDGLQIEVSKVFPFDQSVEAYKYAEKGGVIGKAAIEVS
ncbi:NAD(P)-dependent alcohol dehydrogenase [Fulvivirga maritima]|uniref:NAD(P)-dependent alcohol dehydrogenase n=1 Tax=Fulvivirga maritima TaxID=2904247 RepID=UPI001F2369B8|nr:NAD(P)-dependent alcohol dehydrogenase [Fulvivirga maritima]UII26768.1 NAD(P)-dependent alcohol dehydrogenase [Fulvivirga maritima]